MSKQEKSHSKDFTSLNEWLCYLETIHNTEIDLGLSRISQVAQRLQIDFSFARVITVAGTNGKGTTCAFLENALLDESFAGKNQNVAVYSSPHIEQFNERLRINKCDIDDKSLIFAFEKIEQARAEISLSYYEFTTLAAFLVLMTMKPEIIILEVGLGGRLDATNLIDADVSVITSVDLDHQAFLGNDRESIGFEKAGIMRANQHIIVGDPDVPASVVAHAHQINELAANPNQAIYQQALSKIKLRNRDFYIAKPLENNELTEHSWHWQYSEAKQNNTAIDYCINDLIKTHIPQDNVATGLMVLKQLGVELTAEKVNKLIEKTKVAGRTELFNGPEIKDKLLPFSPLKPSLSSHYCDVMLDVGHNPHAGRYLAQKVSQFKVQHQYQRVFAVVGMLSDKDIQNTLAPFNDIIDDWFVAPLTVARTATSEQIATELAPYTNSINCFDNITQAFKMAYQNANSTDLVLVFGSFFTVAEIRQLLI